MGTARLAHHYFPSVSALANGHGKRKGPLSWANSEKGERISQVTTIILPKIISCNTSARGDFSISTGSGES